jgi:hypothetical protein
MTAPTTKVEYKKPVWLRKKITPAAQIEMETPFVKKPSAPISVSVFPIKTPRF